MSIQVHTLNDPLIPSFINDMNVNIHVDRHATWVSIQRFWCPAPHIAAAATTLRKALNAICIAFCSALQEVVGLLRGGPVCPDSAIAVKRLLEEHHSIL